MMGWYGGGMNSLAWMGMGLFWLLLLGLIAWLVLRLLPGKSRAPEPATTPNNSPTATHFVSAAAPALAIIEARLASGEVDVETYRAIRSTLLEGRDGER